MKSTSLIIWTLIAGSLLLPASSLKAQGWKLMSREEIEAKVHPSLHEQGGSILRFDTCRQSVGTLQEEDAPRTVVFNFQNVSKQNISLSKITTSCGCTAVQFSKKELAPNEKGIISVTFNPKNRPGTIDADAWVYTSVSTENPVARLSLSGYVNIGDEWKHLPQQMGHLRLSRKQITISAKDTQTIERIVCANSGNTPLKLKALLLPSCLKFHTEPSVLAPGKEADIVITLDATKLSPDTHTEQKLRFIVDGVNGKPSERTIEVIIKP